MPLLEVPSWVSGGFSLANNGETMRSPVMNAVANTLCYVSVTPAGVVSVASVAALSINDRVDLSGFLFQTS